MARFRARSVHGSGAGLFLCELITSHNKCCQEGSQTTTMMSLAPWSRPRNRLCSVLQRVAVCCSVAVRQRVAMCCSVLQCISVLQCVAVRCSEIHTKGALNSGRSCPRLHEYDHVITSAVCCSLLQFVAICCSVFQFVSVLQCVAVCCGESHMKGVLKSRR